MNKIGCIIAPLAPGRKEPNDKSEMVTQLLFGEVYELLELRDKWALIKSESDGYECWIDRKFHVEIEKKPDLNGVLREPIGVIHHKDQKWAIPCGSRIGGKEFEIGSRSFSMEKSANETQKDILFYANQFLGAPYLWGGKSIMGVDCSGFVQVVFSCMGIHLPRDAYQQADLGETVDFVETSKPGDLAFFDNEEGRITHVGIMIDGSNIIHASGTVRIDRIDHAGIFNGDTNTYSHQLRIVKRVLAN
jgi:hypothetical protein